MVNRICQYLLCSVFLATLVLGSYFGLYSTHRNNSEIENRRLADLPQHPENWQEFLQWPQQLEKYYQDHFGFRFTFLSLYRQLKYQLGDLPLETAILGNQPGWIFYNNPNDGDPVGDYRNINRYSDTELQAMIGDLKRKHDWFTQRGIVYVFVIAPSKHTIYPEYLPQHITPLPQENMRDQLKNALQQYPEITVLDLSEPLLSAKKPDQLLYYKADSHWNEQGINIAQYHLAQQVAQHFPEAIQPHFYTPNEYHPAQVYYGDLAQYTGLKEQFTEYRNKPILPDCTTDPIPSLENYNRMFTSHCPHNSIRALVFRDSFFTHLQPYVSAYFAQATFVWEKIRLSKAEQLVQQHSPHIVIEQWAERFLPRRITP